MSGRDHFHDIEQDFEEMTCTDPDRHPPHVERAIMRARKHALLSAAGRAVSRDEATKELFREPERGRAWP